MASIWVIPLALLGFLISAYIHLKKEKGLVCLISRNCDKVVQSQYSSLFGVPNEDIGMVYYLIAIALVVPPLFLGIDKFSVVSFTGISLVAAGLAAAFSLVLLQIQAFRLRAWCEYCVASTAVTVSIFLVQLLL